MQSRPTQPAHNLVKTKHILFIDGCKFIVEGKHERLFAANSKLFFSLHLILPDSSIGRIFYGDIPDLRVIAKELIANSEESKKRAIYHNRFKGLSLIEIMSNEDFLYGRFIASGLGNYYNIYCRNIYSPTGVTLEASCNEAEFETAAKATNNEHNYLVGNEGRRIVNQ